MNGVGMVVALMDNGVYAVGWWSWSLVVDGGWWMVDGGWWMVNDGGWLLARMRIQGD